MLEQGWLTFLQKDSKYIFFCFVLGLDNVCVSHSTVLVGGESAALHKWMWLYSSTHLLIETTMFGAWGAFLQLC